MNICTKNYQNLIIGFQVTAKNVGDVFWDSVKSALDMDDTQASVQLPISVDLISEKKY